MKARKEAATLVLQERERLILKEGYTSAHDDEHTEGQLAFLAAAYALSSRDHIKDSEILKLMTTMFKYSDFAFKPKDPIRDLTRAGALILAELERRLRAEEKP